MVVFSDLNMLVNTDEGDTFTFEGFPSGAANYNGHGSFRNTQKNALALALNLIYKF